MYIYTHGIASFRTIQGLPESLKHQANWKGFNIRKSSHALDVMESVLHINIVVWYKLSYLEVTVHFSKIQRNPVSSNVNYQQRVMYFDLWPYIPLQQLSSPDLLIPLDLTSERAAESDTCLDRNCLSSSDWGVKLGWSSAVSSGILTNGKR